MSKGYKQFAVFDIDGTLIRWQLYHAVVDRLGKKGYLTTEGQQRIHEARMVWKRREHPDAFRSYEKSLITTYEEALPNITTDTFDAVVEEVAAEYKAQVYTYTRQLAKDLKAKGYTLIAISGSHQELVGHVARLYNFDLWVGTEYKRSGNHFTGEKFVGSKDKKAVLHQLTKQHELSHKDSWGGR